MTERSDGGIISAMGAHDAENRSGGAVSGASTGGNRLEAAVFLLLVVVVTGIAWWLEPGERGYGTHQQLVPIPCGMHWLVGLPCPMCGLTTAFALMVRGEVIAAFGAHLLGPVLYLAMFTLGVRAGYALVRGTSTLPQWALSSVATRVTLLVLLLGWAANLARSLLT